MKRYLRGERRARRQECLFLHFLQTHVTYRVQHNQSGKSLVEIYGPQIDQYIQSKTSCKFTHVRGFYTEMNVNMSKKVHQGIS